MGGESVLDNTLCIQLEVSFIPLYEGQPSFGEVDLYLRRYGFLPHCIAEQKNIMLFPVTRSEFSSRQLFEMDIVYIKDFRDMTIFTEEQLKQMALIMHYCYDSVDMVIRCLKTIDEVYNKNFLSSYIDIVLSKVSAPSVTS